MGNGSHGRDDDCHEGSGGSGEEEKPSDTKVGKEKGVEKKKAKVRGNFYFVLSRVQYWYLVDYKGSPEGRPC